MESFGEPTLLMSSSYDPKNTSMEIDEPFIPTSVLLSNAEDTIAEEELGFGLPGAYIMSGSKLSGRNLNAHRSHTSRRHPLSVK